MIIDILVGAVLVISAIIAFLRGFVREALTIAGIVGGVAAAYAVGPAFSVHMDRWLGVQESVEPKRLFGVVPYDVLSDVLSYGLIFLAVVIAISILSQMVSKSARALGLGPIDRTLGVVFGLLRGAVLLALLYLPLSLLVDTQTKAEWFEGSRSYVYLEKASTYMAATFLPAESREKLAEQAGKLGENLDAREKLQAIDVLRGAPDEAAPPPAEQSGPGYNQEFREHMDELFQEKAPDQNE
jgi:membrane protein required for colicin V production